MVNKHFFGAITRWQRASLQCATDPVPPTMAERKVADLWDDNKGWKWEIFADRIPQTYRKIIASHNLRGGGNLKINSYGTTQAQMASQLHQH